jgi:hypothetical protein
MHTQHPHPALQCTGQQLTMAAPTPFNVSLMYMLLAAAHTRVPSISGAAHLATTSTMPHIAYAYLRLHFQPPDEAWEQQVQRNGAHAALQAMHIHTMQLSSARRSPRNMHILQADLRWP